MQILFNSNKKSAPVSGSGFFYMGEYMVDRTALKTNQFFVILFSLSAYLVEEPFIILCLGFIMLTGAVYPKLAVFQLFYHQVIKPLGLLKPEVVNEVSNPHQFAQAMGGTILIISTILIVLFELALVGWGLILLVALLALTNLFLGFCAGCFIYFQFSKALKIINPKGDL